MPPLCTQCHLYSAQNPADTNPNPSYASSVLSWTRILLDHFIGCREEGWGKYTPGPTPAVPSAVNTPHRLYSHLVTSIQRSGHRLLYDCLGLFLRLHFFSSTHSSNQTAELVQQSCCLCKRKSQWISEYLPFTPHSISLAAHYRLY